jgi:hypothetical protein
MIVFALGRHLVTGAAQDSCVDGNNLQSSPPGGRGGDELRNGERARHERSGKEISELFIYFLLVDDPSSYGYSEGRRGARVIRSECGSDVIQRGGNTDERSSSIEIDWVLSLSRGQSSRMGLSSYSGLEGAASRWFLSESFNRAIPSYHVIRVPSVR